VFFSQGLFQKNWRNSFFILRTIAGAILSSFINPGTAQEGTLMKRRSGIILITTAISMALLIYFQARIRGLDFGARTNGLLEYTDPVKVIETGAGREFVIVLESNPTTGYSWHLAGVLDKKMLRVVEIQPSAKKIKQIGAGGKDLWTLQGLQPGESRITFDYARPWEKNIPPVKRAIFTVRIRKS
jgi:inhibitor of cysteine peptidase